VLIAANITLFIALLLLAGAAVARFLYARTRGADESLGRRGATGAIVGALLLAMGAIGRLLATTLLMRDGEPIGELLLVIARDTVPGRWTAGLALLAIPVAVGALRWPGRAALGGALVTAVGLACSGHASEIDPRWIWVTLDALHAFGALLWIGGLLVIVPALRFAESGVLLAKFSPLALTGAALAIATGIARAWTVLPAPNALVTTTYGRLLFAKSALVLLLVALGWLNYRAHAGRLTLDSVSSRGLERRARIELLVASAVIVLTGWLSTASPLD
jgi:copper transport protein